MYLSFCACRFHCSVRRNRLQPKQHSEMSENVFNESPNSRRASVVHLPIAALSRDFPDGSGMIPPCGLPRVSWGLNETESADEERVSGSPRMSNRPAPNPAPRRPLPENPELSPIYRTKRITPSRPPDDFPAITGVHQLPSFGSASSLYHHDYGAPAQVAATAPSSRRASFQSLTPVLGDNEIDVVGRQLRSRHPDPEAQYLIRTLKEELEKFRSNMEADYSLI